VTAGGKKVAPADRGEAQGEPIVGEAVLLGDGKAVRDLPARTRLREARDGGEGRGNPARDRSELIARPDVRARLEQEIERVNQELAQFEKIKRFAILDRELTQESGELTPTPQGQAARDRPALRAADRRALRRAHRAGGVACVRLGGVILNGAHRALAANRAAAGWRAEPTATVSASARSR
jgi:long-subunit acyl-CoA synthetase (AMP-forming)